MLQLDESFWLLALDTIWTLDIETVYRTNRYEVWTRKYYKYEYGCRYAKYLWKIN